MTAYGLPLGWPTAKTESPGPASDISSGPMLVRAVMMATSEYWSANTRIAGSSSPWTLLTTRLVRLCRPCWAVIIVPLSQIIPANTLPPLSMWTVLSKNHGTSAPGS